MKNKLLYVFVLIFICLLTINSFVCYISFKNSLEKNVSEESSEIANSIKLNIDRSIEGKLYIEELAAKDLREASIAILHKLDPDYRNVTTEQLMQLRNELGVSGITLLTKSNNDVVGMKSTDEHEVGLSTKDWGYWFDAFNQLLEQKPVTVKEGQKLNHYWSGPIDFAASDATKRFKYGYYYDGTTNYIINPYMQDTFFEKYNEITGSDKIADAADKESTAILEITGFNPKTFGSPPIVYKDVNGNQAESIYDQPILFGKYTFVNTDRDKGLIEQALALNRPTSYQQTLGGIQVVKHFLPIVTTKPEVLGSKASYVIGIVYSNKEIQKELHTLSVRAAAIVLLSLLVSILILLGFYSIVKRTEETAVQYTSEQYTSDINKMFAAIRGQQHDLNNHINTINALVSLGKYTELKEYLAEYIDELHMVNDIIKINHPIIAAQIQSKTAMAINNKIQFTHEIFNINHANLSAVKSIDFVKMIGNLLDNAFDEVSKLPIENRIVKLRVWMENGELQLCVQNPLGKPLGEKEIDQMFNSGYTTKPGSHKGLGLSIVTDLIDKYKGKVDASAENSLLTIRITIPMK